jgi:glucose-1-phosphate adenylyltransferase
LPVNAKDAPEFGIKTNAESCIESFIEKPAKELLWLGIECSDQMKSEGKII